MRDEFVGDWSDWVLVFIWVGLTLALVTLGGLAAVGIVVGLLAIWPPLVPVVIVAVVAVVRYVLGLTREARQ